MKTVLVVAAFALCGAASAGGFTRARTLEPAASFVARKPVTVWCAKSPASWRAYVNATNGPESQAHGLSVPGSSVMHLDPALCLPLLAQLKRQYVYPPALPVVIHGLTHEAIHLRGETDEGVTDCDAMHEMPGVAVRFFHVTPGKKLRALMAGAWKGYHAAPTIYRTVCG